MNGIIASKGIAIGKSYILKNEPIIIEKYTIDDTDEAISELHKHVKKSSTQLLSLYETSVEKIGQEKAEVFKAHNMMLNDPAFIAQVESKIKNDKLCLEYSVDSTMTELASMFESLDDEYMRERAHDLRDVSRRLIRNIKNIEVKSISEINEKVILIADDLTPSDTVEIDKNFILGFVTKEGGKTSHTAILARTLDIPALVGVGDRLDELFNNQVLILDGMAGKLVLDPAESIVQTYEDLQTKEIARKEALKKLLHVQANTKDGKHIEVCCNIGSSEDVADVLAVNSDGIGLFRTEFLFMNRDSLPTEEEQFDQYKAVVSKLGEKATIIRTLDIGGDKELKYFDIPKEDNPFLGWRALRICLDRVDIFKTQLRAILRASAYGKTRIMFPMVIALKEIIDSKAILETCKSELKAENIKYDEAIEIGIMVETPAAVLMAETFIQHLDFFSIGTNDLTQYTLAVDRGNKNISDLYDSLNPAVVRAIAMVIKASHKYGKWTGMCGEFAGDPMVTKLLIGLGLDEFSMSHSSVLEIKKMIVETDSKVSADFSEKVLGLESASEIREFLSIDLSGDDHE